MALKAPRNNPKAHRIYLYVNSACISKLGFVIWFCLLFLHSNSHEEQSERIEGGWGKQCSHKILDHQIKKQKDKLLNVAVFLL